MESFHQLQKQVKKSHNHKSVWFLLWVLFTFLSPNYVNSEQIYFEGKEADEIIKFGKLQEKIQEEDHTHLVIEYQDHFFWCTIEKSGNQVCGEY